MNVMHVMAGELKGGAARGAKWLHDGLINQGVDSNILIQKYNGNDEHIKGLFNSKIDYAKCVFNYGLDKAPTFYYQNREKLIFSTGFGGFNIRKEQMYKDADLINLHWINLGLINPKIFNKIEKPIVWTLRDMWAFTGGCHYSMGCEMYKYHCTHCSHLKNGNKFFKLTDKLHARKQKLYPKDLNFIAISNWLKECAEESTLLSDYDIEVIPNCIDTKEFKPIDLDYYRKEHYRKYTNGVKDHLGFDKNIVLVGANNIHDSYKGFDKFKESLLYLNRDDYNFVFFGNCDEQELKDLGINYYNAGYISSTYELCCYYSLADVFVMPSIQEAFGKTTIESMACGTPVVAFNTNGAKDIITDNTGYLADPFDACDLANGIDYLIDKKSKLTKNNIKRVKENFSPEIVSKQYIDLYKKLI